MSNETPVKIEKSPNAVPTKRNYILAVFATQDDTTHMFAVSAFDDLDAKKQILKGLLEVKYAVEKNYVDIAMLTTNEEDFGLYMQSVGLHFSQCVGFWNLSSTVIPEGRIIY